MKLYTVISFFICITSALTRAEDCKSKNIIADRDFSMAITDDYFSSLLRPFLLRDFRPWRYLSAPNNLGSTIKTDEDKFQISLDVQYFAPSEITVKVVDRFVVVEAKHEEKKDEHGFVSRHLLRRYSIPDGVESDDVVAQLSSDGILTVSAPRKQNHVDRVITIEPTGPKRTESEEKDDACTVDNQ